AMELPASLTLNKIVGAILALASTGCWCRDVEDEPWTSSLSEVIEGTALAEVRGASTDPEERCKAACVELSYLADGRQFEEGDVTMCEAEPVEMNAGDPED